MKKIVTVITFLIVALNLFSQEQPNLVSSTKVTTIGYWNIGDKIKYHVITSDVTTKSNASKPTKQSTNTYDLELLVADSTEHSYVLEMKYLTTSSEGVDPRLKEIMMVFRR